MGRREKWWSTSKQGAKHVSLAEREKRARLQAEIHAELARPLTPGVQLTKRERETIAGRVVTGAVRQSVWPRSGVSGTHVAADL